MTSKEPIEFSNGVLSCPTCVTSLTPKYYLEHPVNKLNHPTIPTLEYAVIEKPKVVQSEKIDSINMTLAVFAIIFIIVWIVVTIKEYKRNG